MQRPYKPVRHRRALVSFDAHRAVFKRTPAEPGQYLRWLKDIAEHAPGTPVVPLVRESGRNQVDNLVYQKTHVQNAAAMHGLPVLKTFSVVAPANTMKARKVLREACHFARKNGAIVVAESTSRFVRSGDFRFGANARSFPNDAEFRELMKVANGVTLATVWLPEVAENIETSLQTRRGMATSQRRGGRPRKNRPGYKKWTRERDMPKALRLRQSGKSIQEVSEIIGRKKSTVQYWIDQDRTKFCP